MREIKVGQVWKERGSDPMVIVEADPTYSTLYSTSKKRTFVLRNDHIIRLHTLVQDVCTPQEVQP